MTNQEVFEQYNTEKWLIEQNIHFLIQEFWDECLKQGEKMGSQPPINTVSFIKEFMKKETICDTDLAEKSKMETLENNIIDADFTELS